MSPPPKRTGIAGLVASFGYALIGLRTQFTTQANARIHALATVLVVAAGFWCGLARLEWCAIIAAIGLVWTAEGLNTALEFLTDLVSPEHHPLAEKAKDVAAGAVLTASIAAMVIGAIIFVPKLLALAGQ
jgi:diacylglycerol kinase (ATP)